MSEPPGRRRIPVEMGEFICPFCGRRYPTLEALHRRAHRHHPRIH